MRTIIFGTYDTAMHPRIATIAEGMAARGFDVTECNIPLGLTTADRVDMLAKPWKAAALVTRLVSRWAGPTWSWLVTWAISTCCWPGCCTAGARCRSCSIT